MERYEQAQAAKRADRRTRARLKKISHQRFSEAQYESEMQKFEKHLEKHGLKVHEVDSDGNCLFGAISDQLYGSEDKKDELRQ